MKKSINLLAITSVFVAGISTVSATISQPAPLIAPGMMNDFQDGTTMGWTNGKRVLSKNPPVVKQDGDNYYLETVSFGEPDRDRQETHNQRMVAYNATFDWTLKHPDSSPSVSKWSGDYSNISSIEGRAMATSDDPEVDKLYLRIGMSDWFTYWDPTIGTYPEGSQKGTFYTSNKVVELPTSGEWIDFSIPVGPDDFSQQQREGRPDIPFADALKSISEIRFISNKEPSVFFGGDIVEAKLGLDDIKAVGTVPLPGAVWLMISGLLSLGGLSSYKRCHAA